MDGDAGGWLWLVIDVAMVSVLAIALIYGTMLWRQRRSRALQGTQSRGQSRPGVKRARWSAGCGGAGPPEIAMLVCAGGPA
jgi:hypothetical protein